jgi:CubicO group peptidase (beta-lactamase class C family)
MSQEIPIEGWCDPRFEAVRTSFRESFAKGEVGASVAVVLDGDPVIDLWGGHLDVERTRAWQRDTIANVYSTTKGMTALCAQRLVDEGRLDLDVPVAHYWPEFAQQDKEQIPVRDLLCHRSGVAAFPEGMRAEHGLDWDTQCSALAAQTPLWKPGSRHGYHAVTFGHLVGEVVRRIDGRSLGRYFREEIAEPLGLDFHIGLPDVHHARVSDVIQGRNRRGQPAAGFAARIAGLGERLGEQAEPGELRQILARSQRVFGWGPSVRTTNSYEWRCAEVPAANGHGNARSVARFYGALARGGELDGVRMASGESITRANTEHAFGSDGILFGVRTRFGLGYFMTHPGVPFGPNPRTFGHPGAGGSVGFADPDARLGFGYVMNQLQGTIFAGSHGFALIEQVYRCLA